MDLAGELKGELPGRGEDVLGVVGADYALAQGTLLVYVDNSQGNITADEQARIDDAIVPGGTLQRLLDPALAPVPIPGDGIALSRRLASRLSARVGDRVVISPLAGPSFELPVAELVEQYIRQALFLVEEGASPQQVDDFDELIVRSIDVLLRKKVYMNGPLND